MTALVKVLGAFAAILVVSRLRVPLSLSILLGAAALGVAFGQGPWGTAGLMLAGAAAPSAWALVLITVLLLALSETMASAGQLQRIVETFAALVRRPAVAMAALPALIGLLPMPGGALFSAPMVRQVSGRTEVAPPTLSAINYWFRHIWEHWWPMYPGVILAMTLTRCDPGLFILTQVPLGISMAVSGLVFLFRGTHPDLHQTGPPAPKGTWRRLVRETSAIWVIVLAMLAVDVALRLAPGVVLPPSGLMRRYVPIGVGLLVSLVVTVRLNRLTARHVGRVFGQRKLYTMAFLVLAVMIFQHVLEGVGAVEQIPPGLRALHIPPLVMVMFLPFVSGMVTGLAIGFVGTSFPVVIAIVAGLAGGPELRPYAVLAYACGHLGQMLSPIHLCHVVSNQYFGTGFRAVYRRLIFPAAACLLLAVGYFAILRYWVMR